MTCPTTGRHVRAPAEAAAVVLGGRYRLLSVIGRGGMGTVWLAEHQLLRKKVAVKLLLSEQLTGRARQRFEREARIAGSIGHPSIVKVYDLGHAEDGAPYLVMEHLSGQTLAERVRETGPLPFEEAVTILSQVLDALSAAHRKGIVHRDLKPDNVFLARQESGEIRAKLLDFGVSKSLDDIALALTGTGVIIGTPYYLSPEQARGAADVDHRVDLWAAGVVLYEMLTGALPFRADNYHAQLVAILQGSPLPPSHLRPDIAPALEGVVLRALDKDRARRFSDARSMLEALRKLDLDEGARTSEPAGTEIRRAHGLARDDDSTLDSTNVYLGRTIRSDARAFDDATEVSDSSVLQAFRISTAMDTLDIPVDVELDPDDEAAESDETLVTDSFVGALDVDSESIEGSG